MALNQTRICLKMPPMVQSTGLVSQIFRHKSNIKTEGHNWYDYSLPRLQLQITLIFAVYQILHFFLRRIGVPLFSSQLIAGLVLSQSILQGNAAKLWTEESVQVLGTVASFGYGFFTFLIGVKMDPSLIANVNKRSFSIGILSVIAPLICAVPVILFTFDPINERLPRLLTFVLSSYYAVASYPVISLVLSELKILNSELGRITLSSAVTSDFVSIFMLIVGNMLRVWKLDGSKAALNEIAYVVFFLVFVFLVVQPWIYLVIKNTPEGKPVNETCIYVIMLIFLVCICSSRWLRVMPLSTYIIGLAIPHGPPLGSALVEKFESMVHNLFLPIYIASCGIRVKTLVINMSDTMMMVNVALALLTLVVKPVACFLPSYLSNMPQKDALAIALLMSTKGIIDLSFYTFLSDESVIDYRLYGFLFCIVLYSATVVPVVVKYLYDPTRKYAGYNKRNLMHWKPYSELHILSVIHVPDNVDSVLNLLEAACPTKENPLLVDVLHLIKLNGQANPIFISHQNKRRTNLTSSYSENLIISFNKFQGSNYGAVSINAFTAVSPANLMHDDICTLALDNLASLIILPFHRRWYMDGTIESDNDYIRALNSRVLEKAPCSVGILIDRGNMRSAAMPLNSSPDLPSYNVAIIFLGGSDDREALTLVKRMSMDTRVVLTVVHLTTQQEGNPRYHSEDENEMIDNEMLREVKSNGYISYMEKGVADGPETAMIVHSMVNEFNLIIVGRRLNVKYSPQTSGLEEWSEFPELGVLGDLLASIDYRGRCSVLVVQQQETVVSSRHKINFFS